MVSGADAAEAVRQPGGGCTCTSLACNGTHEIFPFWGGVLVAYGSS